MRDGAAYLNGWAGTQLKLQAALIFQRSVDCCANVRPCLNQLRDGLRNPHPEPEGSHIASLPSCVGTLASCELRFFGMKGDYLLRQSPYV
jgi:hypothetical protein